MGEHLGEAFRLPDRKIMVRTEQPYHMTEEIAAQDGPGERYLSLKRWEVNQSI